MLDSDLKDSNIKKQLLFLTKGPRRHLVGDSSASCPVSAQEGGRVSLAQSHHMA